ncbi:unnamed protein product, partial [Mesorhabditis belari]|uniref:C2H2-type domain-containing protein n=1 Tax=Mesorhabditis belari TaxID=2138241 RepID=A0AAF3J6T0_9BILA
MEGVARLIPSKTSRESTSKTTISLDNHEDFDQDTPFSYETAIPVMESSGQDVLELEMNHNIGYLDAREFGRAASFDSLAAPAYTDEYSDVSYDNLGAPSSYQFQPVDDLIDEEPNKNTQLIDRNCVVVVQQQLSETPIDHTAYSQPPSTEQSRHENNNHTGHVDTAVALRQVYAVKATTGEAKSASTFSANFSRPVSSSSLNTLSTTPSTTSTSHKRSSGRNQPKKEPLDPNVVEEEVARNVSQILSLTKQHRAAMVANGGANARQGGGQVGTHLAHLPQRTPPLVVNRAVYTCPDCNKQVSSTRNLSRHRQSCPASRKFAQQSVQATISTQPLAPGTMMPNGQNPQSIFVRREDGYPDWCSPRSSSVSTASSVREAISHPPSRDEGSVIPVTIQSTGSSHELSFSDHLDAPPTDMNNYGNHSYSSNSMLDDSQGYSIGLEDRPPSDELATSGESGSASRSSDVPSQAQAFQCEACQKTVASLRSLKRHHTTCKPFAQQFPHILEQEKAEAEVRKKKYEEQRMNALESGRKRIRKKPINDQETLQLIDADRFSQPGTSFPTPVFQEDEPREFPRQIMSSDYYGIPHPQYRPQYFPRDPGATYTPQLDHLGAGQVEFWSPYEGQPQPTPRQTQNMPTYQNLQPMGPRPLVQVTFQGPHQWVPHHANQMAQMNSPVFSPGFHPMSAMSRSSSSSMVASPMVERAESRSGFLSPVATPSASNFPIQPVQIQQQDQPLTEADRLPSPDSSSASNGVNQANTTCPDCQRQLCSASNLKRHRATCKAAATGVIEPILQAPSVDAPSPPKAVQWASQEVRHLPEQPDRRYVVLAAPSAGSHVEMQIDQQRPFITVGEHLKAQQQKMNPPQQMQRYEPGIHVVQQGMQLGAQNGGQIGQIEQIQGQQIIIAQQAPINRHSIDGAEIPHSAPPHLMNGPQFPAPIQRSQSTNYPQQYVQNYTNGNHLHMNGHPGNGPSHLEENGKLEEDESLLEDAHAEYEVDVDEHYGYGFNSATDVSDLEDELREQKDRDFHLTNGYSNGQNSLENQTSTETTTINGNSHGSALRAALNSISPPARHTVSSHPLPTAVQYQTTIATAPPLDSIITTQPLPGERLIFSPQNPHQRGPEPTYYVTHVQALPNHQSYVHPHGAMSYALAEHPMSPNMNRELGAMPATPGREVDLRFQCPECLKTYSCRKNVKRHRMAVHKLTPEEIARNPGSGDYTNGGVMQSPHQILGTPHTPVMMNSPMSSAISPNKGVRTDAQWDQQQSSQSRIWAQTSIPQQGPLQPTAQHMQSFDSNSLKTPKREPVDGSKKAMTELAEADTTFSEDAEEGKEVKHELASQPMSTQSVESQPMEDNSPIGLVAPLQSISRKTINTGNHTCNSCQRVLSSEYSLKRHRLSCAKGMGSQNDSIEGADPMIAQGNSVAPQPQKMWITELKRRPQSTDGGISFEEETAPDSTTQRGGDSLAHSPCNLSSPSENGEIVHTRKRRHSASEISVPPAKQTLKHLCQKDETLEMEDDSKQNLEWKDGEKDQNKSSLLPKIDADRSE